MDTSPAEDPDGKSLMPGGIPGDRGLRASDSDRERAVSVLQGAMADGRLSQEEMEARAKAAYNAKSRDELALVLQDLQPVRWADDTPTATKDVGVINGIERTGRWAVGKKYRLTVVIGTAIIDLRRAEFTSPKTTIRVNSWVSTVYIVVPPDAEVQVEGMGIVGAFKGGRGRAGFAASHRIKITGMTVCADVHVVRELPPERERRLQRRERGSIE